LEAAILTVTGELHTHELDPSLIVEQLPSDIRAITSPMTIRFKSDLVSIDMDYNAFMSKNHKIDGNILKLGYRKLQISDLKMELIYTFEISTE